MFKKYCKKLLKYIENKYLEDQDMDDLDDIDELKIDTVESANLTIIQDPINNLILFNFNKNIRWIGFDVEQAKTIIATIQRKIDVLENKNTAPENHLSTMN